MTRLQRLWRHRTRCRNTNHERDWQHDRPDRCIHCQTAMPFETGRTYVGRTHPSCGD